MKVEPHANLTITLLKHHLFGSDRLLAVDPSVEHAAAHHCPAHVPAPPAPVDTVELTCPKDDVGPECPQRSDAAGGWPIDWPHVDENTGPSESPDGAGSPESAAQTMPGMGSGGYSGVGTLFDVMA